MRAIIATAWSPEGLSIMTSRSLYSARSAVSGEKREMMNLYNSKILIIDDNRELGEMVMRILKRSGYQTVLWAGSCIQGMTVFKEEQPQLVLLDVMLPDGDGFSLFRKIRDLAETPILFLSAKDEDNDRLFGLGLGADDYITKPFLPQELILRVGAVLKRTYFSQGMQVAPAREERLVLGKRTVSFADATVSWEGKSVSLTAKELQLLKKLNENRGNIVTFDALCFSVWGDPYYGYENTLMVHIRHLREKIEENPSSPQWILTARGLGYRLAGGKKSL